MTQILNPSIARILYYPQGNIPTPSENAPRLTNESVSSGEIKNNSTPRSTGYPSLADSIALSIRASSGAKTNSGLSTNQMISEQEIFACLVHQRLAEKNPALAERFAQELPNFAQRMQSAEKGEFLFKASDRILRSFVRSSDLSHSEYQEIRNFCFGKAQLDSDRTNLSPLNVKANAQSNPDSYAPLLDAINKMVLNPIATDDEIQAFRAHTAALSRAKFQANKVVNVGQHPSEQIAATQNSNTTLSSFSGAGGLSQTFVWKPISDSDHKLVVVLPASLTSKAVGVKVLSPDGSQVLAQGDFKAVANGGRQHYRFDKPGSNFPAGSIVQISMRDGTEKQIKIANTSEALRTNNIR